ncbi:PREDICTED: scopoletin glucosyltransferase-like isoform X1 [Ipomoea nil]|uniref:scopoletin glucosyltransferase-like isoform X1 n=1 Tax=Ipomoea nil TaxID=35883 RepID=UPI0009009758|nr:PREDICTED: scopoletin glucosyltransferase-like isoform X1 [Ipomoea nil]
MGDLHVFFFPFMAHGHMIPTLDMAKLFASRGVKATIITTPANQPVFSKAVEKYTQLGFQMEIRLLEFPAVEVGLPEDCESADKIPSVDGLPRFHKACAMLQPPLEHLLQELRPNCLVADMFFPWATEAAAKFDIPRLIFHGSSYLAMCAMNSLRTHKPFNHVSSDSELFTIPNLPHELKLTRLQVSPMERSKLETPTPFSEIFKRVFESEDTSYGVIFNSFYELEPDYAEHYKNVLGRRAWSVGPLSLFNTDAEDKAERGKKSSINEHECLKWLDSKNPHSVVYICFGSTANFAPSQLHEMAMGIEDSGLDFVWVIRNKREEEKWMPEGFEERTKGKGLIIRGWAPQVLILDHPAVGAFVTHCGWNSTLEGVCAGVPFVTWPLFADQFLNEKLMTDILRTGSGVGSKEWKSADCDGVKREAIAEAMKKVMIGEESEEMRSRVKAMKDKAKKAIEEGGSSYLGLSSLLDELRAYHAKH